HLDRRLCGRAGVVRQRRAGQYPEPGQSAATGWREIRRKTLGDASGERISGRYQEQGGRCEEHRLTPRRSRHDHRRPVFAGICEWLALGASGYRWSGMGGQRPTLLSDWSHRPSGAHVAALSGVFVMELTGAEIIVETLKRLGVDTVFGIPGGANLPMFDKFYDSGIRVVLTRHEQGASHMADGYARASGKPGVCLATSGPGATNLVTGLATAHMDSIPVIAITGQVRTDAIGSDAFQEADTTGVTRPITKHNYLVKDVRDL